MKSVYKTRGICAREIAVELENGLVKSVDFTGGCHGNLQGISKLVVGMKAEELVERLEGIQCETRGTSCPDQLSRAVKEMIS